MVNINFCSTSKLMLFGKYYLFTKLLDVFAYNIYILYYYIDELSFNSMCSLIHYMLTKIYIICLTKTNNVMTYLILNTKIVN